MKITKFGHCCLLIEENEVRILTDPGNYSVGQDEVKNIDAILITHEHADHVHMDSLKKILKNNPQAEIITNKSVGKILDKEEIKYQLIEDGQNKKVKGVLIEGYGNKHAYIYTGWLDVQNTGYFVANKLFYPGDVFYNPGKKVEILALPVAGPWCKISDSIDYALEVKPSICFPVHDGALKVFGGNHKAPATILPEKGIEFIILEIGKETEL